MRGRWIEGAGVSGRHSFPSEGTDRQETAHTAHALQKIHALHLIQLQIVLSDAHLSPPGSTLWSIVACVAYNSLSKLFPEENNGEKMRWF